jgi:hypothetical protein
MFYVGLLGLLVFGGLALAASFFHCVAMIFDPRYREEQKKEKAEFQKRMESYREEQQRRADSKRKLRS